MSEPQSSAEWGDVYADLRPTYRAFVERLADLFETLLDDDKLPFFRIDDWSMGVGDFEEAIDRAKREGRTVDDPFAEITDVFGISLSTYTSEEGARIADVVERELEIDRTASLTFAEVNAEGAEGNFDRLEYPYARYPGMLDDRRASLPEWTPFAGLRVQIDVQTLLQYAWDMIDATLAFHWPSSYAPAVRAAIARARGHVTAADRELVEVDREARETYSSYEEAVSSENLELELNCTSLAAYLTHSPLVRDLIATGESVGLRAKDDQSFPDDWELEQRVLWLCRQRGIDALQELDDLLSRSLERAEGLLRELTRVSSQRGFVPWATAESIVAWLILVLERADTETVALTSFSDEITYALNTLIGNPVEPPESP